MESTIIKMFPRAFTKVKEGRTIKLTVSGKVKNILIPNTSELDIVKYVDTQLKYSSYATYKYNVFVHRVVFGSRYKYLWYDLSDPLENEVVFPINTPVVDTNLDQPAVEIVAHMNELGEGLSKKVTPGPDSASGAKSEFTEFSAAFKVHIEPSIKIIEDEIFSTPDIIIMDKPPVIPDVNIIPYRAVNNKIKILITGASDRYRAKPILMLDGDKEEFDKIKAAQLSFDEKVEFGSDDPVKNFQIFRIQQKPKTYSDFELYNQISQEFFEEVI